MSEPQNCLVGWKCPSCGKSEGFNIDGASQTMDIKLFDDGTEERYVHEVNWEPDCRCTCVECDYQGIVADFSKNDQPENDPNELVKVTLLFEDLQTGEREARGSITCRRRQVDEAKIHLHDQHWDERARGYLGVVYHLFTLGPDEENDDV